MTVFEIQSYSSTSLPIAIPGVKVVRMVRQEEKIVPSFPDAEEADFSRSGITEIGAMPLIKVLNVSFTMVQSIPGPVNFLTKLDIRACVNITQLPDNLPSLTDLDASGSGITRLPDRLPKLKTLAVANTGVAKIPEHLPELVSVDVSGTPIRVLTVHMPLVETVTPSSTEIVQLDAPSSN